MSTIRHKALLAWSSGKDSAWTLHVLRQRGDVDVVGLLTTLNADAGRVAMHGVREELVEAQAAAAGLPLRKVNIPANCSNETYDAAMRDAMQQANADGITAIAFGDLFLEDIRRYREERLQPLNITPLFPIWGQPTDALSRQMVQSGLQACITCVDTKQLDAGFVGRTFDAEFLDALPAGVDPCGENGEFHSVTYAGPMFAKPIAIRRGEIVDRGQFVFADVIEEQEFENSGAG